MSTLVTPPSSHQIVTSIFSTYDQLPKNGKPKKRDSTTFEWTILASLCLCIPPPAVADVVVDATPGEEEGWKIEVISLGTGLSCLPFTKLSKLGDLLNDSHAEIIARRGFLVYLYNQLELLLSGQLSTPIERVPGGEGKFRLKEGIQLVLYVSTLPCGDASTYSLSLQPPPPSSQPSPSSSSSEPKPKPSYPSALASLSLGLDSSRSSSSSSSSPPTSNTTTSTLTPLVRRGRANYTSFSTLRTKPGRIDSSPSISHSCSDKISFWTLVGIQGGLLAHFFVEGKEKDWIKIDRVIIGGIVEKGEKREKVLEEVERALGGRLVDWDERMKVRENLKEGRVKVPRVEFSDLVFKDGREVMKGLALKEEKGKVVSCLTSLSYIKDNKPNERHVIEKGVRQGCPTTTPGRKKKFGTEEDVVEVVEVEAIEGRFRSNLSKLSLFERYSKILDLLSSSSESEVDNSTSSYYESKHSNLEYQRLKLAVRSVGAPFEGWLITGKPFESFGVNGKLIKEED